jgi:uncharacterized protein DUF4129
VQVRAAAAAAAMAVLLAVAALGSNGDGHGSLTPPGSGAASTAGHHILVVAIVVLAPILAVIGGVLFVYAQVHRLRERDAESLKKIKQRQAKTAAAFMLALVGIALWIRSGRQFGNPFGSGSSSRGGSGTLGRPGSGHPAVTGNDWTAVIVIWVVLTAAAVFLYLRHRASRATRELTPLPVPAEEPGESEVARLQRVRDPRRAVIAAYAAMERLMARDGVARGAHEAPMEYLGRVTLHGHHRVAAVHRLTALFQRGRFSDRPVDEDMRRRAIDAVGELEGDPGAGE